jgi:hypothetical protein
MILSFMYLRFVVCAHAEKSVAGCRALNGIQDQFPSFQITMTGHLLVQHFMFYVSFAHNVIGMNSIVQGLLNSFVG